MRKRIWIICVVVMALVLCIAFGPGLYVRYRAVKLAEGFLSQPHGTADVMLTGSLGLEGELSWLDTPQGRLWRLESAGVAVYYCGGVVYLENGKGYDFSGAVPELPESLWQLLPAVDVERAAGEFRITLDAVSLTLREGASGLTEAEFTLPELSGSLTVKDAPAMEPPAAVLSAMASGAVQGGRDLTEDVLALMRGWAELELREPLGMELTLQAELGPVDLSQTVTILRSRAPGFEVFGLTTGAGTVYFGNGRLCSENGSLLAESEAAVRPQALLGLVYELCLNGELECEAGLYRLTLDEAGMRELLSAILPQTRDMKLALRRGTLTLQLEEGAISEMTISCEADLDLLLTEVETTIRGRIRLLSAAEFPIPGAVMAALAQE